jgi:hypothetical protein
MNHEPFIRVPVVSIPFRIGKAPLDFCDSAKTWEEARLKQKRLQETEELEARAAALRNDSVFDPKRHVKRIKIFQAAADIWECVPADEAS